MNGGRKVFKKVSQNLNLKKKSGRNFKIEFQNRISKYVQNQHKKKLHNMI